MVVIWYMLMMQIKLGLVVLFYDIYFSIVDVVYQFILVFKVNGYCLVIVSELFGLRVLGSSYGSWENGLFVNELCDILVSEILLLFNILLFKLMFNFLIIDIVGQNLGGLNNGV